ncbi:response regulator transcription factor [Micromonospora sp. DT53]|uniref:response regulator transcription factor n=1 Tax=Micromonospora sp. DT53 TaxID=3393444 RepID=UPI003CE6D97D
MIRVVVADDDPLVGAHLRTILGSAGDIEVVDTVADGAAAVEAAIRHRPDLVLMDLRMPGVNGLVATEQIAALHPAPVVVVLTTFTADRYLAAALRAGASGYVLKTTPPREFANLVRTAAAGHLILPPGATRLLLLADLSVTLPNGLSERDRQILAGLGQGLTNAQLAAQLHLTEATVKGYVSRVLTRLGCTNRTEAALLAQRAGLVRYG